MRTHGRHKMVTENSKTTNFRAHFLYNTSVYWLANLLIKITFLYWQVCFRWVKETNETINLEARFFIAVFILINKLTCRYNFSLLASFILYGKFRINKRVCLTMHHFCSIDNCDRILENSSKSYLKSSVFLHVFNDISNYVYVFTEYFLHSFSNLSIEFLVVL